MNNQISEMESAAQAMAVDLIVNPHAVEQAFTQHLLLLMHKREMKAITFKDYTAFIAICAFTTKMANEKSDEPSQVH